MSEETMIDEKLQNAINLLVGTANEIADVVKADGVTTKLVKAAMLADNVIAFTAVDYDALAKQWKEADEVDRALIKEAFADALVLPVEHADLEAKIETIFGWAVDLDRILREAIKLTAVA